MKPETKLTNIATNVTPEEARAIAKEAYVYGFPLVDSYRIQYSYFVDPQNPEFKASWAMARASSGVTPPEVEVDGVVGPSDFAHATINTTAAISSTSWIRFIVLSPTSPLKRTARNV